ncbi:MULTISPECIES: CDP-glycerol glycerophosphotransferase family protein [Butyricimonas]|uniref:CDP-glycerol glycerophosphotransferase family protein n=1 Tax=Butyricimonas TaxID=574697 RepID=UPI0022E3B0C7|nr:MULTISPECIES: CDP-glycerol glycerophosphotransferase family protein [Butyricimonas]
MKIDYLKKVLKKIIPNGIKRLIYHLIFRNRYIYQQRKNQIILKEIQKKNNIKIVFFVLSESAWKYGKLYDLLKKSSRFDPCILVCPIVNQGDSYMKSEMEKCYTRFKNENYKVYCAYNFVTGEYFDVKKELNPDIIFYSNPYRGLIDDRYYITHFSDVLTCYVPYAFMSVKYDWSYDLEFHNLLWTFFIETELHKKYIEKRQCIHGINLCVSGYPGCDAFMDNNRQWRDVWKIKDKKIKRIIWAPHHLLHDGQCRSNFLNYYEEMLVLAKQYEGKIQIAFKPHPLLKQRLLNEPQWGPERTKTYFQRWAELPNGQLEEGVYDDLFLSSDALIHDCGSFLTEYLYIGKPSLFMISPNMDQKGQNEFGKRALEVHYLSYNHQQVIDFIDRVVLGEDDYMHDTRKVFLESIVYPPHNQLAAENIMSYLENEFAQGKNA